MSLEAVIAENTATMKQLIAVLQSGGISAAPQPESGGGRKKAEKPTATPAPTPVPSSGTPTGSLQDKFGAVNNGKSTSVNLQPGDPEGTVYVHIPAQQTVAAIHPGQPIPNTPGAVEVDGAEYASLKAKYTPASASPSPAAAATGSPAAAPASTTPAASTASSPSATTSPTGGEAAPLDGVAIVAKCQALHKAQGNEGLKKVLDKFGAAKVPNLATQTEKFGEIAAFIDALMAPPSDANLF